MSCSSKATEPSLDLNELQMCVYAAEEQTLCFRKLMLHGVLTSQEEIMSVSTSKIQTSLSRANVLGGKG